MLGHIERCYFDYSTEQFFELVADVEKYPEFMPWILSCHIVMRQGDMVWVDMVAGIGGLQQGFSSRAVLCPPHSIDITSNDGPFDSFHQRWQFGADEQGRTVVAYSYDFSLRSHILALISAALLDQAVRTAVDAFERRARQVYGTRPASAKGLADG
jgi:coenzyme Q-binding protein COQ10